MSVCLWGAQTMAERLGKEAEKAERNGQIVEAYLLYARAAAADPRNPLYWTKATSLRPSATLLSEKRLPALGTTALPPKDPANVGSLTFEQLQDLERMKEPPHLKPFPTPKSFHLRGDAKTLFEQVALQYGYTVIFDKDYNLPTTVKFDVDDIDYKGVLHALETATNSFIVPLSEKAMLVAQDTQQKRQELEPNEAIGIPIPQRTSAQEAQELMMMVQQALEIRRVALDPVKRLVYMRDRASKVELARALFTELSGGKPQVSVEVEFLSTGSNSSLNWGLRMPTQFPLVNFGSVLRSSPTIPAGFARFLTFGGGLSFLGMGLTDAALFATASRSSASTLLRSQVTASDGQPATLHIGDRYPIQTSAYIGAYGSDGSSSTTYAAITTASYADVTSIAVSNNRSMKLVVNTSEIPFTIPEGANSLLGLENIINSMGAGIVAQTIQRGTTDRPYSMLVVASTLGITSIQLIDDPDGAKISMLKLPGVQSSLSKNHYPDETDATVSTTGILNLTVGTTTTPLNLTDVTNNLDGLRDAINQASAGVTASVLNSGSATNPYYLQIAASSTSSGVIQVYDDPSGANTALFSRTDEVDAYGSSYGNTVTTSGSSLSSLGQTYSPPPTFNFEDLGLVLKITPFVHDLDEVTLEVEAEFKVLGSGSYNGVPVISTRKYQGKIRLLTNQYAVIAGLMSDTDARSITGLAGVSSLPLLGPLLRENTKSRDISQVLLVIKPTVTSFPASELAPKTYWFGSEMKPLTLL